MKIKKLVQVLSLRKVTRLVSDILESFKTVRHLIQIHLANHFNSNLVQAKLLKVGILVLLGCQLKVSAELLSLLPWRMVLKLYLEFLPTVLSSLMLKWFLLNNTSQIYKNYKFFNINFAILSRFHQDDHFRLDN